MSFNKKFSIKKQSHFQKYILFVQEVEEHPANNKESCGINDICPYFGAFSGDSAKKES